MATTDRQLANEIGCPCGHGKVRVFLCEPDHPYVRPSQRWTEVRLECPHCQNNYEEIPDLSSNEWGPISIRHKTTGEKYEVYEGEEKGMEEVVKQLKAALEKENQS